MSIGDGADARTGGGEWQCVGARLTGPNCRHEDNSDVDWHACDGDDARTNCDVRGCVFGRPYSGETDEGGRRLLTCRLFGMIKISTTIFLFVPCRLNPIGISERVFNV